MHFVDFQLDPTATKLITSQVYDKKHPYSIIISGTAGTEILDSQYGKSFLLNLESGSARLLEGIKPFDKLKLEGWTPKSLLRYFEPKDQYSMFIKVKMYNGQMSAYSNKLLEDVKDIKGKKVTIHAGVSAYFNPDEKVYGLYLVVEKFVFP